MFTILKFNHPALDNAPAEILGLVSSMEKADKLVKDYIGSEGGGPYSYVNREYKQGEFQENGDILRIYTYTLDDFSYRLIIQYYVIDDFPYRRIQIWE